MASAYACVVLLCVAPQPPLWKGLQKLDMQAVQAALRSGANPNETNAQGACVL
jgi:hypothetical protein